jgi:hypothetical protein
VKTKAVEGFGAGGGIILKRNLGLVTNILIVCDYP